MPSAKISTALPSNKLHIKLNCVASIFGLESKFKQITPLIYELNDIQ